MLWGFMLDEDAPEFNGGSPGGGEGPLEFIWSPSRFNGTAVDSALIAVDLESSGIGSGRNEGLARVCKESCCETLLARSEA